MKRKIVQIITLQETEGYFGCIYALCDDGTVWKQTLKQNSKWILINTQAVETADLGQDDSHPHT